MVDFMTHPSCLHHVRWERTLYCSSDASELAIAGWAWQYSLSDEEMQRIPKAQWPDYIRPVAFVSRRLRRHEKAWNKPCGYTPGYNGAAAVQELLDDPANMQGRIHCDLDTTAARLSGRSSSHVSRVQHRTTGVRDHTTSPRALSASRSD